MASSMERAAQIRKIIEDNPGIQQHEIADRLGVSKATVSLAMLGLRDEVAGERSGRGIGLKIKVTESALRRRLLTRHWK